MQTPADLTIRPRDLAFGRKGGLARWWLGGDPVATAFFNALSASFPQGERFFIDSVKRYRNAVPAALREQIGDFILQELIHTREHIVFNRLAEASGYDLSRLEAFIARRLDYARQQAPLRQLAATAALEHFTAILAHALLADPRHVAGAPDEIQRLWCWHAMEEIEHKGVAYDTLLEATSGMSGLSRWMLRSHVMVFVTVLFSQFIGYGVAEMFAQDGLKGPRVWLRFAHFLFVRPGIFRRVLASYFAYYRPGFHPWHVDDRALATSIESQLMAAQAAAEA